MRKSIKYLVLVFVLLLIGLGNVKADDQVCKYNRRSVKLNNTDSDTIEITISTSESGSEATSIEIPLLNWNIREVKNWQSDADGITAASIKYKETGKCPSYLLVTYNWIRLNSELYAVYDESIAKNPKSKLDQSLIHVYVLSEKEQPEIKKTCNYPNFKIYYDSNSKLIAAVSTGNNLYSPSYDMITGGGGSVDGCLPVYSCNDKHDSRDDSTLYYDTGYTVDGYDSDNCTIIKPTSNEAKDKYCNGYDEMYSSLLSSWNNYENCKASRDSACVADEKSDYNSKKDVLTTWCNTILSHGNYGEGCVNKCLNLSSSLYDLENANTASNNTCGVSDRLILWIENILNWVKYLLPALIVILSAIDYIKAIGAEKDDEMKKAQKKLVTRLIAAALTFIIPSIVAFIIEKMGFVPEYCGLFK